MKNHRLMVSIEDGQLVVRVGIHTLAGAFEESPKNLVFDDGAYVYCHRYRVTDVEEFVRDVKRAMMDEAEDGSSPLTRFFDQMFLATVDDGSIGIEESNQPAPDKNRWFQDDEDGA